MNQEAQACKEEQEPGANSCKTLRSFLNANSSMVHAAESGDVPCKLTSSSYPCQNISTIFACDKIPSDENTIVSFRAVRMKYRIFFHINYINLFFVL